VCLGSGTHLRSHLHTAKMPVSVNVKMTAENKSEIPTMTKFQQSLPPSFQAAMYSVDVEPSHKVMDLKKKVRALCDSISHHAALRSHCYAARRGKSGNISQGETLEKHCACLSSTGHGTRAPVHRQLYGSGS
jgi:hypothetical protein